MLWVLVLPFLAIDGLQLEGPGFLVGTSYIDIIGRGEFLAVSNKRGQGLAHWDREGRIIRRIKAPDDTYFLSARFDGEIYWVCAGGDLRSMFYDASGRLLHEVLGDEHVFNDFMTLEDELFGTTFLFNNRIYKEPYLYQLQKLDLSFENNRPVIRAYGSFGKVRAKQRKLLFNFFRLFMTKRGSDYLLMNEVENKVFIFDQDNLTRERQDGTRISTEIDFVDLDLVGYVNPPDEMFSVNRPMPRKKAEALRINWLHTFSRIAHFSRWDSGYLVAYTLPVCEDQVCRSETGLQVIDSQFRNTGVNHHIAGWPLGFLDGKFYTFENPEDPSEGTPIRLRVLELEPSQGMQ